jgi:hypothetical protein
MQNMTLTSSESRAAVRCIPLGLDGTTKQNSSVLLLLLLLLLLSATSLPVTPITLNAAAKGEAEPRGTTRSSRTCSQASHEDRQWQCAIAGATPDTSCRDHV